MPNNSLTLTKRCADEFSIVMSVDNNYLPYLGVTVRSLIEHANKALNYTVYVLHTGILGQSQRRLRALETSFVKVRFIDVQTYLQTVDLKLFYLTDQFTVATYFRFFIPLIFTQFDKVLYCDCDAVFMDDAAKALQEPLGGYLMAAVRDFWVIGTGVLKEDYWKNMLKLKDINQYFNGGFLVFNVAEMKRFNFTQKCLERLSEIKKPRFVDQCVLNSVCQGHVKFLSGGWNIQNQCQLDASFSKKLPRELGVEYDEGLRDLKYLHFAGSVKPWLEPSLINADDFFKHARLTPFYEQIIYDAMRSNGPSVSKSFLEKIFSIKKCRVSEVVVYKIVTFFGLEIKFRLTKP